MDDAQELRYSRHLLLDDWPEAAQERLLAAHAVVIGAGGLGAPALLYLASAGVGRITVIDPDTVELSNLQRQIAHSTERIGQPKVDSARTAMAEINPEVQVQALEAGQRVERVESAQDPATAPVRMYYVGWSSSTGEADWALRPLLASESFPPRLFNTAYYKNEVVDNNIARALTTTDRAEKTRLYTEAQQQIWKDAPWAFLVTERSLSVRARNLAGFYVMPDWNFNFDEIELK